MKWLDKWYRLGLDLLNCNREIRDALKMIDHRLHCVELSNASAVTAREAIVESAGEILVGSEDDTTKVRRVAKLLAEWR